MQKQGLVWCAKIGAVSPSESFNEGLVVHNKKDIRWKQRFDNFEKSYKTFERILKIKAPNEAEKMGLIQAFEIVFELSWKTLKDFWTEQGYNEKSPRGVLKQAFQNEIIIDGRVWLEALESRNETTHTYDDEIAIALDFKVREVYAPAISELYYFFVKEYNNASWFIN